MYKIFVRLYQKFCSYERDATSDIKYVDVELNVCHKCYPIAIVHYNYGIIRL